MAQLHITQHIRFMPYGTHPNPSLTLRTSFMLGTLSEIKMGRGCFERIVCFAGTYFMSHFHKGA